ncbi:MAG: aminoacyl-tRNA hydrolase [Patescibacteria group bacterium]
MSYIIVGLGNPGAEYENTRHNTGRIFLEAFRVAENLSDWETDFKTKALISSGKVGTSAVMLIEPETFMNKSGDAVKKCKDLKFKTTGKGKQKMVEAVNLAVIHDDLDIPFGKVKISFNKSSGGHRGVESIMKAIKTESFVRVRVGISPVTPKGDLKKPKGEEAVDKHILGKFSPDQLATLKKLSKTLNESLHTLVVDGREMAMSQQSGL